MEFERIEFIEPLVEIHTDIKPEVYAGDENNICFDDLAVKEDSEIPDVKAELFSDDEHNSFDSINQDVKTELLSEDEQSSTGSSDRDFNDDIEHEGASEEQRRELGGSCRRSLRLQQNKSNIVYSRRRSHRLNQNKSRKKSRTYQKQMDYDIANDAAADNNPDEELYQPKRRSKKRKSTSDAISRFFENSERIAKSREEWILLQNKQQLYLQNDVLYLFFMSMYNITKGLPLRQQRQVRRKLFQVVTQEEEKAESEDRDQLTMGSVESKALPSSSTTLHSTL